jgi:hypothetical protein
VAEDIDTQLSRYREDAANVTKQTGVTSLEDLDSSSSAQHLKTALTLLPELRERKAILDMHMNILTALLKGIKDRQLDNFFQTEEAITKQSKAQILEIINDKEKFGNEPMDKLRLFVIWYLSTEQELSRADMDKFEEALKVAGADVLSLVSLGLLFTLTFALLLLTIYEALRQASPRADTNEYDVVCTHSARHTIRINGYFQGIWRIVQPPYVWIERGWHWRKL